MSKRERGAGARYEEIAVDIARRIVNREYREGDRILGRSHLAGTYKVSPETIRRAIAILHDHGVVRAIPGSGIRVVSRELAAEFLESLQTTTALAELQAEMTELLARRRELDARIEEVGARMAALTSRAMAAARKVEEVEVPPGSWLVGRTLASARLRNHTGCTVIAVFRNGEELYSPGPDFTLEEGDLLMVVGSAAARERLQRLLTQGPPDQGEAASQAEASAQGETAEQAALGGPAAPTAAAPEQAAPERAASEQAATASG